MIEGEDQEKKKKDGETAKMMSTVKKGAGERRYRQMSNKDFQGRGKAVRQSAGLDGSGGEEKEQTDNPDWAARRDDGWAANRETRGWSRRNRNKKGIIKDKHTVDR